MRPRWRLGLILMLSGLAVAAEPAAHMGAQAVSEAQTALGAGQWSAAITAANRALTVWPEQGDLLVLRGLAHYHLGEAAAALNDLEAGLAHDTRYRARALLYTGLAAIAANRPERVTSALDELLVEHPTSPEAARLRALVPPVTSAPDQAVIPHTPSLRDWWSGYLALTAFHDDDPAQSAATGNTPAEATYGLGSWAQLDVTPPDSVLGLRLLGSLTDYPDASRYADATLGSALVANGSPWSRGWLTALLGVQREWSGHDRFGDSLWAETTLVHRLPSGTELEAFAQARRTLFADPERGHAGSEGEALVRLSDFGHTWWYERARLATGVNREVDRQGLGSWSALQVRGDWRLGEPQHALVEFHASWEQRYAVQDARPARRLFETGATLWLPLVNHLALTGFVTSQWAGENVSWATADRMLFGLGTTWWW